jgi:plastocyanin
MHARIAGALAVVAVLAAPAAAGAATKTVQSGPFAKGAQFQQAVGDANQFFRRTITIRRGDRVRWRINGFHSVTFAPPGGPPPPLAVPDPATPIAGVDDAAGNPFWFNDQPQLRPNPEAILEQGDGTFSRSDLHNSGLPLAQGPPPPYTLRFNRKGTFGYLCVVHPGMTGKVRVRGRNANVPSARKDRRAARRELNTALRRVQRLSTGRGTESLQNAVQAGNDRRSGPTVFKFFPEAPRFRVGDNVTLQMSPRSSEIHTFTFGPTNGQNEYNDQLAAGLLGDVFDPRGAYPSEPPPAVPSILPGNHGNGFYNSGFLDADSASPLPASTAVTFGAPGDYQLICLIHPFMRATVTVTP